LNDVKEASASVAEYEASIEYLKNNNPNFQEI